MLTTMKLAIRALTAADAFHAGFARMILNRGHVAVAVSIAVALLSMGGARGENPIPDKLLSAVVKVSANVPDHARTAQTLGTRREGSGIVIDDNGLILTIGYLVLESASANIELHNGKKMPTQFVAYDHGTGLGLLRAVSPLKVKPLELGDSTSLGSRDEVLVASFGGQSSVIGAYVVSRRGFAGFWEYMLDSAIYTAPPHPKFGGAALIDRDGKLVGVGSLIVPNAVSSDVQMPGNMFVPINLLKPILGDLLTKGRSPRTRPWLGLYPQEVHGRIFVARVPRDGPAHRAGLHPGDLVLRVTGQPVRSIESYYRKVWALGRPGVDVPLTVLRGDEVTDLTIRSIDRNDWFRVKPTY